MAIIKGVHKEPGKPAKEMDVHDWGIDIIGKLVGSPFDVVTFDVQGKRYSMYVDDEGLINGALMNIRPASFTQPIAGAILVVGPVDDEGDDTSLDANDSKAIIRWLDRSAV